MRTMLSCALLGGLWALPSLASAQTVPNAAPAASPPATHAAAPAPSPGYRVVREGRRVVYEADPDNVIVVHGEPQRPYAFAVSGRSPLGYTATEETPRFVPAVVAAVRRDPF